VAVTIETKIHQEFCEKSNKTKTTQKTGRKKAGNYQQQKHPQKAAAAFSKQRKNVG
jgi:hypothetical protein